MGSTASNDNSAISAALDALGLLEQTTDEVTLLGASLNQEIGAGGELDEVIDVYWKIPGRPGTFTSRVPFLRNWPAIAFYYVGVKQALVRAIYAELPNKAAIPAGQIGPPLPPPDTAVAF